MEDVRPKEDKKPKDVPKETKKISRESSVNKDKEMQPEDKSRAET